MIDALKQIREIVSDVTQMPVEAISEKSGASNVYGWDSVAQLNIIVAVETEFGVTFTGDEIHSLNSVGQILEELRKSAIPAM